MNEAQQDDELENALRQLSLHQKLISDIKTAILYSQQNDTFKIQAILSLLGLPTEKQLGESN